MSARNRRQPESLVVSLEELRFIVAAVTADPRELPEEGNAALQLRLQTILEIWERREKYEAAVKWILTGELNLRVEEWQVDAFLRAMPDETLDAFLVRYLADHP